MLAFLLQRLVRPCGILAGYQKNQKAVLKAAKELHYVRDVPRRLDALR